MAQQNLNLGTGNDTGDGDTLRAGMTKVEANTTELYARINVSATTEPTVNDDSRTYEEGTIWVTQSTNKAYVLVDGTVAAAVWQPISIDVTFESLTLSKAGSTTALDITQSGSGIALNINNSGSGDLVQVDTDKLVVKSNGRVGVGGAPIQNGFGVFNSGGGQIRIYRDDATILLGEELGTLAFQGTQGSGLVGATIRGQADENWAAGTNSGSRLIFRTTTSGAATPTDKMVLDNAGNVGIGTTSPGSKLSVVGLPTYADDSAAGTGGLSAGDIYKTATGELRIKT